MGAQTIAVEGIDKKDKQASKWAWLKILGKLMPKLMCMLDDAPIVVMQNSGVIGPILLVCAGFVIFFFQIGYSIYKLVKLNKKKSSPFYDTKKAANVSTLLFASIGLLATCGLVAFIKLALPFFAAVSTIAIPCVLSIICIVELAESISKLKIVYRNAENLSEFEHKKAVTNATRSVIFNSVFLALSLAVTALAIVGVLSGLSVISVGVIPTFMLITVVAVAFVLKVCEIADNRIGKSSGDNFKVTNVIHRAWLKLTNQDKYLNELNKEREVKAHRNLYAALNVGANEQSSEDELVDSENSAGTSNANTPNQSPTVDQVDVPELDQPEQTTFKK